MTDKSQVFAQGSNIHDAISAIVSASVGSCTCNAKSPEIEHHEGMCRYALLMRALDHLNPRSPAAIERIEAVTGEQEPIAWQWHVGSDCWTPCEPPTEDELKDNPSKFRPLYLGRMPSAPACHEPHNSGGVDPLVTRDCAGAGTEVAALHREIVDRQAEIIRLRAQVEQLKSPAATEQSQRDYDHGYGVGYEHGIKEASAECEKLLGLVESATAWLDQEITRAADQQRQSYARSGEHGQRQGERWHARQIALYEAKLKLTSTMCEKPTCKLCGLEDGACICRSIPSTEHAK
jgi:hypothetical protein